MTSTRHAPKNEWTTRKRRIDPRLDAAGWMRRTGPHSAKPFRTEEHPTQNGPADYALCLANQVVGVVEAKKLTVGPQNVLTQAERYSRGLDPAEAPGNHAGLRAPFLYATNGEVTWFHDVRHPLNRSRRVADFHTATALGDMLGQDFDADCERLLQLPNAHNRLRPYQKDANAAVEKAIAKRKRHLLVAMATGTGKTFTLVNQIYRLMKAGVARLLPKGTVCLSRTASVGYVLQMGKPMTTSQDFVNWVCSDALNPEFLMFAIMAEGVSMIAPDRWILTKSRGTDPTVSSSQALATPPAIA